MRGKGRVLVGLHILTDLHFLGNATTVGIPGAPTLALKRNGLNAVVFVFSVKIG